MSDPTYEYIKGLGWQPFPTSRSVIVTFKNGERYRLIDKVPEIGDLCIWGWSGSYTYSVKHTSTPNLLAFADYLSRYDLTLKVCTLELLEEVRHNQEIDEAKEVACWVTIVKL